MNVNDLPDHLRALNPDLPTVAAPKPKQGTQPNRTELEYWRRIEGRGTVLYEAMKLRLGHKCWYTPDFMVSPPYMTPVAPWVEMHEVKGPYIHEDAMVKFKTAASRYPCFRWFLAQKKRGGVWTVEEY